MEPVENRLYDSASVRAVQARAGLDVRTLSASFSERGLVKSVQKSAEAQKEREEHTRVLQPEAYRLSSLSEQEISARYRRGKETMSTSDLVGYIHETRAVRTRNTDFSEACPDDESVHVGEAEKPCCAVVKHIEAVTLSQKIVALPAKIKQLPAEAREKIKLASPMWFDRTKTDTTANSHRFPLSAFAALIAVAVSLMLIVASSVMVKQGENMVNELTLQAADVSGEIAELKSDLNVQNDLLEIREIAVNELGMVSEEYVKMSYLSLGATDSIEAFEEEREQTIGISALLSAIGVK
ncbi:MAG: hypothetical protein IJW92_09460 [Clostridia bacterium]|nr:hypothetical protein [Clostridia bacterium]